MEANVREDLEEKLDRLGVPAFLVDEVEGYSELEDVIIPLKYKTVYGEDIVHYKLYVQYNSFDEKYDVSRMDVSLRKPIDIPSIIVHGIDIHALDLEMDEIDWNDDDAAVDAHRSDILSTLMDLSENDHPIGIDLQAKLMLKYLVDTQYGVEIADVNKIMASYEIQRSFDLASPYVFTATQAYNLLSGRPVGVDLLHEDGILIQWISVDNLTKDITGMPVLLLSETSEYFDVARAIRETEYGPYLDEPATIEAMNSLKEGNSTQIRPVMPDGETEVFLLAEPWNNRVTVDYRKMEQMGLYERFDQGKLIAQQTPEKEKMIEDVKKNLAFYGFDQIDEQAIRLGVYFDAPNVSLSAVKQFGPDKVVYNIAVTWREGNDSYFLAGFDAALTKEIRLPYVEGNEQMAEIENRFKNIDWSIDYLDPSEQKLRRLDVVEGPKQAMVDKLLSDLDDSVYYFYDGTPVAGLLLYKYWAGTPNEKQIPDRQMLAKALMIEGKFELFSYLAVNADEAYQLLNGQMIPRPIEVDLGQKLSPGYLVIQEIDNRSILQWVPGQPIERVMEQVEKELQSDFYDPFFVNDLAEDLMRGEMVRPAPVGQAAERFSLKLAKVGWEMQLFRFSSTSQEFRTAAADGLTSLFTFLNRMGVEGVEPAILRHFQNGDPIFSLEFNREVESDKVNFRADFRLTDQGDSYDLQTVRVSLLKFISVPDVAIDGIRQWDDDSLETRMQAVDWRMADYYQWGKNPYDVTPGGDLTAQIHAYHIFEDLLTLYASEDLRGKWIAEALSVKYLLHTLNEGFLDKEIRRSHPYEIAYNFQGAALSELTLQNMYNLVDGRSVLAGLNAEGRQEWYQINFHDLGGNVPINLEKKLGRILGALENLPLSKETSFENTLNKLLRGDVVDIELLVEGKNMSAAVFGDPSNGLLVFENLDLVSDLGNMVFEGVDWSYHNIDFDEIGQYRDYQVHPVPFDSVTLRDILEQMNFLGIPGNHESNAKHMLQRGYTEFTLDFTENLGPAQLHASVPFKLDEDAPDKYTAFKYSVSYDEQGGKELALTLGEAGQPLLPFNQALNVVMGRATQYFGDGSSDIWYTLDTARRFPDGTFGLKEFAFPLEDVIAQIERMPLRGVAVEPTKQGFINAIRSGDEIETVYVSGKREVKGWLSFDWRVGKVRFSMDAGRDHLGRRQDLSAEQENTNLGNGRRRK